MLLLRATNQNIKDKLHIDVASDDWEALKFAQKHGAEEVVLLEENIHEDALVVRLKDSLVHSINMAICLTQDERIQKRAAKSVTTNGVLVIPEHSLVPEDNQENSHLRVVETPRGNIETLQALIQLIARHEVSFPLFFYRSQIQR